MELATKHYKHLIDLFDTHILSKKSIKTGNHYSGQAKEFLWYLEKEKIFKLKKVDEQIMKSYFNYLIQRPKKRGIGCINPRTVNDNLSTLRIFSLRMQDEKIIDRGITIPKNLRIETEEHHDFNLIRQVLSVQELKEVFENCETEIEKALISLAYGSGLRRGSLANLKDTNIDFEEGHVTTLKGKNNKTITVPISDFFLKVLRDYMIKRLHLLSDLNIIEKSFFVTNEGKP